MEVQVGPLFGLDLRPTRLFVWAGAQRRSPRVVSFGRPPTLLRVTRRRRRLSLGPVRVTTLGNPLVTIGKTGVTLSLAARLRERASLPRRLP